MGPASHTLDQPSCDNELRPALNGLPGPGQCATWPCRVMLLWVLKAWVCSPCSGSN